MRRVPKWAALAWTGAKGNSCRPFVPEFKERTRGKHLLGSRECNFLRTGLPRAPLLLLNPFFFHLTSWWGLNPIGHGTGYWAQHTYLNLFQTLLQATLHDVQKSTASQWGIQKKHWLWDLCVVFVKKALVSLGAVLFECWVLLVLSSLSTELFEW